ncbi:hypothetical protein H6G97_02380 [Nostoc flagelliforme FACHB-838]|uniref:Uncharacterized protein n=1 Tax=Nostoc flagelliforme FACHB-838 TaxID=2692904 RepID=A0ABR8DGA7_9NOSO|nr:hypothetical protein [Nostoc flagelliforme]MBD2528466.1 hypothetical protein [Nostoc flagelliforme FACHB-838]
MSEQCSFTRFKIKDGNLFSPSYIQDWYNIYIVKTCPSCVVAHDEVSGSRKYIFEAFVKWSIKLDDPQRRELISLLGNGEEYRDFRLVIMSESSAAVTKYWEVRKELEEEEQEGRR